MDTPAANKALCSLLFDRVSAGDVDGVMALLADDATWWLAGKPGRLPVTGERSRAQVRRMFDAMAAALEAPLAMTVLSAIAEGDEVAMEVESRGRLKNGRAYEQLYHFRLRVRDGRIAAVREYLDTLHVHDVWAAP